MASPTRGIMLRALRAQDALTSGQMPSGRHPPRGCMTAVWMLAMTAKEPYTLVMVTLGGTLSRSSGSLARNHR
jgi:hypothetical protein